MSICSLSSFSYTNGQILLAILHLGLGVWAMVESVNRHNESLIEVTLPSVDQRLGVPENVLLTRVNLFVLIGIFSFWTFAAHCLYAIFNKELASVYWRWLEYSFSASLMLVIISLLAGVKDFFTLLSVFGLMSATQSFGQYADWLFLQKITTFYVNPIWEGWWPYALAWVPVFVNFFRAENVPAFVVVIIFSLFVLFSSFAFVQLYYVWWNKGKYDPLDNEYIRRYDGAMHVLSLVAKAGLTFQVIFGIINLG